MRHQFLCEIKEFVAELSKTRIYSGSIDSSLEFLERSRLVCPRLRVRYPDPIVRRLFKEDRQQEEPIGEMEPDGERWDAAVELENSISMYKNSWAHGRVPHPLLNPAEKYSQFITVPANTEFVPWDHLRTDVSTEGFPGWMNGDFCRTFYATWQILQIIEVADAGIHFHFDPSGNISSGEDRRKLFRGELPDKPRQLEIIFPTATQHFLTHERILDAVTYFAESYTIERNLLFKGHSSRFLPSDEEIGRLNSVERKLAFEAWHLFSLDSSGSVGVINACNYLSRRWKNWERDGRPLFARAYKSCLSETIRFLQLATEMSLDEIKALVGDTGCRGKPVIDEIWPDWQEEQRDRVSLTLHASVKKAGFVYISEVQTREFSRYLSDNAFESFFWIVADFEEHALRGNSYRMEAMQIGIQTLSIVVEHLARKLCEESGPPENGDIGQLIHTFRILWRYEKKIENELAHSPLAKRAKNGLKKGASWQEFYNEVEKYRKNGPNEAILADLLISVFIRGAVHYEMMELNHFELEDLFVCIMRSALHCYCVSTQVRR